MEVRFEDMLILMLIKRRQFWEMIFIPNLAAKTVIGIQTLKCFSSHQRLLGKVLCNTDYSAIKFPPSWRERKADKSTVNLCDLSKKIQDSTR